MRGITVVSKDALLGPRLNRSVVLPWRGQRLAEIVLASSQANGMPWDPRTQLAVLLDGERCEGDELMQIVLPGAIVTVAPDIGLTPVEWVLLLIAIGSAAYSYYTADQALQSFKMPSDRPSPTYSWDSVINTSYGAGFRVPLVYGEHRVGGQVINSQLEAVPNVIDAHLLRLDIALGDGRIESIGGITGGPFGEANQLTRWLAFGQTPTMFPSGLLINDLLEDGSSAVVSLRMGAIGQSMMAEVPTSSYLVPVGIDVTNLGTVATVAVPDEDATGVDIEIRFPRGNYIADLTGGSIETRFKLEWRQQGGNWVDLGEWTIWPKVEIKVGFSRYARIQFSGVGPFEIRITRTFPTNPKIPGTWIHESLVWSIAIKKHSGLTYPGVSHMAIGLLATEGRGSQPNVSIPIRGRRVRGWIGTTDGWTDPTWSAVLPWIFPLGNNPAWVLADYLLSEDGLGRWIEESMIDLPSFRDWADLCDQPHPEDAAEPLLRFDAVLDQAQPAWETILQICRAGRATCFFNSGKIAVKIEYKDGFQRGSGSTLNIVPDRAPVAVISTSNCRQFEINYADPATRANVLDVLIRNRDLEWQQDPISVEDPEAKAYARDVDPDQLPLTRQSMELFGVTRRIQAMYEAYILLNFNRLSTRTFAFEAGIEHLPVAVGDLVLVQHDVLRPGTGATYDASVDPDPQGQLTVSARILDEGTVGSIRLDRDVTLVGPAKTGTGILTVNTSGLVKEFTANASAGLVTAGTAIPLWDPVANGPGSVTLSESAPVAIGPYESFEILALVTHAEIDMAQRVTRVRAVEWSPEIFTVPTDETWDAWGTGETDDPIHTPLESVDLTGQVPGLPLVAPSATATIGHPTLSWASDTTSTAVAPTRLWMSDGQAWHLLGESESGSIASAMLPRGRTVAVAACKQTPGGAWPAPDSVAAQSIAIPEFEGRPLPAVRGFTATLLEGGVLLRWDHIEAAEYYEIRRGNVWLGAETVATTEATEVYLEGYQYPSTVTWSIRARARNGFYSSADATTTASAWTWPSTEMISSVEIPSAASCTLSGCSWSSTESAVILDADTYSGILLTPELIVEEGQGEYLWLADWTYDARDEALLVEDAGFIVGSAEGDWRDIDWREPSLANPGVDLATLVEDQTTIVEDMDWWVGSEAIPGAYVSIIPEVRFEVNTVWGSYEPWRPQVRLASGAQWRFKLRRANTGYILRFKTLRMAAGF